MIIYIIFAGPCWYVEDKAPKAPKKAIASPGIKTTVTLSVCYWVAAHVEDRVHTFGGIAI